MNLLEQILKERHSDIAVARKNMPIEKLRKAATKRKHRSLVEQLRSGCSPRIVAEVKKASPSAGIIRRNYEPAATAKIYEQGGACGISVLTEPRHFLGSVEHMATVRKNVSLPILRKDFICDAYQICETAAYGGDVVLLIVAALDKALLRSLYEEALRYGLDTIVEAHTKKELTLALDMENAIVGINSRNLATLKCDLSVVQQLAASIPANRLCIAESGIKTHTDVVKLDKLGYDGLLVGEALLRENNPAAKIRELTGRDSDTL